MGLGYDGCCDPHRDRWPRSPNCLWGHQCTASAASLPVAEAGPFPRATLIPGPVESAGMAWPRTLMQDSSERPASVRAPLGLGRRLRGGCSLSLLWDVTPEHSPINVPQADTSPGGLQEPACDGGI